MKTKHNEKKGKIRKKKIVLEFVTHKAYGQTYVYSPIITKETYRNFALSKITDNFFGGSVKGNFRFAVRNEVIY